MKIITRNLRLMAALVLALVLLSASLSGTDHPILLKEVARLWIPRGAVADQAAEHGHKMETQKMSERLLAASPEKE